MRSLAGQPAIRKVLMTADTVGGVWTYAVDLANGLTEHGVEVVLAVAGPDASPAQVNAARSSRVINTGLPLDWLAASANEIAAASKALAALSRDFAPDIVHLNTPAFAATGDFAAPVVGVCHSCMATWWAAVKADPMPADFLWRTAIQAKGLARCDTVLAPSGAFAEAVFRAYGRRPAVALNGRRDPGVGTDQIGTFVFTAGRLWDDGKNLETLDGAAGLSRLDVRAAGPTRDPHGQTKDIRHIEIMGSLTPDLVRAELSKRPIFVSTALYEPFGLTVLEAAQAGCPLVLSDIPTFRELWGDVAIFVDPRNAAQIAATLNRLGGDPERATALGAAARLRASIYTVEAMTEATLLAYHSVVGATAEAAA